MPVGHVLLAAPLPGDADVLDVPAAAAACSLAGLRAVAPPVPPDPARAADDLADPAVRRWLAATALALRRADLSGGPLVVLQGAAAGRAPDLAVALRAARRPAAGYVLVAAAAFPPPQVTSWPDAPVSVVAPSDPAAARRRGWEVLAGYPPAIVAELAARL
jgi:hypothetical protein